MANILEEVQKYVADKLNLDSQLSGNCAFLVENMKEIDYEIKKALGKQGIVGLVMTPKAVYQGKYEDLFHAWQLDELEIDIVENPIVNRGKKDGYITGQDASMHLFEVLCPKDGPYEGQLNPVSYEEGEDGGLIVNRCILKTLVYGEEGPGPEPTPTLNMYFVKLLDEMPPLSAQPRDGWMWPTDNGFVVWQNGQAHELGVSFDQISSYVESAISAKADLSAIHGDYIEDANGNKIDADLNARRVIKHHAWYVTDTRTGGYSYSLQPLDSFLSAEYLPDDPSEGDHGFKIELNQTGDNDYAGSLTDYLYLQGEWIVDEGFDVELLNGALSATCDQYLIEYAPTTPTIIDTTLATIQDLPTKTSDLTNDSGYITNSSISAFQPYADEQFDTKVFAIKYNEETGQNDYVVDSYHLSGEITRDIALNTFYPISGVMSIKFGTGVTDIGDGALSNFSVLREVYFRNTTKRIGDSAFQNCPQLTRVEFEPNVGFYPSLDNISAEALKIGISAFANDQFLYYVKLHDFKKTSIGVDAFANTFKSAAFKSMCPYQGIYFDGCTYTQALLNTYTSSYVPEVSGFCHPWNTVSKEYIDTLNYGKDFSFYEGIDSTFANRVWIWQLKNKTVYNAYLSELPSSARSKRVYIAQDDVDHAAREMYVDLSSDVTIAATSLFATGAAVDWYLNGELSTFKDEFFKAGTHFVWHFMEYQPNHFMVEKVGGVEADLSAKADLSAVPTKMSQLTNDSGFITAAQVPTPDKIEDLSAHVIYANRTVQYIEEVANWTDEYYQDNPLNWDAENNWWISYVSPSYYMKLQYNNAGTWTLEINENIGGEWVVDSASVQDTQDATILYFSISGGAHTLRKGVQQIQTTGELALKSYVDGIVGDINTVLDAINGEEI